jgi:hypothetical protein
VSALDSQEIVALIVTVSFAAGLNLPGTIVTLGLLERAGLITLPGPIGMLSEWWVLGASAGLLVFEFFADKVAGLDLAWNALQTFVRAPAGALLAWSATTSLSTEGQVLATVAGGIIALIAHGGKLALRGAVSTSPEPVSNVAVSLAEDVVAIGLTWFATQHPYLAATIVLVLVASIALGIRWAIRALRRSLLRRPQPPPSPGPRPS